MFPHIFYTHIALECEASPDHWIPADGALDHALIVADAVAETVALTVAVAVNDILAQGMGARLTVFPEISVVR